MPKWRIAVDLERNVPLRQFTTLRAGGPAELLYRARDLPSFAEVVAYAHTESVNATVLGSGSNVLPADDGVPGLVIVNQATGHEIIGGGEVYAETGCTLQDLFIRTAQAGLGGLEFAVGIPGTLGGALVSNAGAYRNCIGDLLTELDVVEDGSRRTVPPSYLGFAYRDSILRRPEPPRLVVLAVRMALRPQARKEIYDRAREYQRQRIAKQPAPASAGSFFKNVHDAQLANRLESLPAPLRDAGVVPAGFLLEAVGLKGARHGGARFGQTHANFILNVGGATATEIRQLAELGAAAVYDRFGVRLEEEVLYIGDWRRYRPMTPPSLQF